MSESYEDRLTNPASPCAVLLLRRRLSGAINGLFKFAHSGEQGFFVNAEKQIEPINEGIVPPTAISK